MITEPKQAKLLIRGMNKACYMAKTTKNRICLSFSKHSLCKKQLHGGVHRLKETLTSMSH